MRETGAQAEYRRTKKTETSIFKEGQRAAIAGKPIFINPYAGEQGQIWFRGYRSPELKTSSHNGDTQRIWDDLKAHPRSSLRDMANRLSLTNQVVNSSIGTLQKQRRAKKEGHTIDHKNRKVHTFVVIIKEEV